MAPDGSGLRVLHVPNEQQGASYGLDSTDWTARAAFTSDDQDVVFPGSYCDVECSQGGGVFLDGILEMSAQGGTPHVLLDATLHNDRYGYDSIDPSPDGSQLVLVRDDSSAGQRSVGVTAIGSGVFTPLATEPDSWECPMLGPMWSPDGMKILYAGKVGQSCVNGHRYGNDFIEMNPDGSDPVVLGPSNLSGLLPSWGTFATNADISVSVQTPSSASNGEGVSYPIVVTNNGPNGATGVVVHSAVPKGYALFSPATASAGTCTEGSPFDCSIGNLGVGASATISVDVIPIDGTAKAKVKGSGDQS